MLATRQRNVAEYSREQDLIGPGSEEIMCLAVAAPRKVCLLLRVLHIGEEDIHVYIFVADHPP